MELNGIQFPIAVEQHYCQASSWALFGSRIAGKTLCCLDAWTLFDSRIVGETLCRLVSIYFSLEYDVRAVEYLLFCKFVPNGERVSLVF